MLGKILTALIAVAVNHLVLGAVWAVPVVSHNGLGGAGSGAVDVSLNCTALPDNNTQCTKEFLEIAQHDILFLGDTESSVFFEETVVNLTSTSWTDYHLEFNGGTSLFGLTLDSFTPVLGVSALASSTINVLLETTGPFGSFGSTITLPLITELDLFFSDPVDPNESFNIRMTFGLNDGPGDFFQLFQIPTTSTVPEPETAALLALGLAGVGFSRILRGH